MIDMVTGRLGAVIAVIIIIGAGFAIYHMHETELLRERGERCVDEFGSWLNDISYVRADFKKTFALKDEGDCEYVIYGEYNGEKMTIYQTTIVSKTSVGTFSSTVAAIHLFNPSNTSEADSMFIGEMDKHFTTLTIKVGKQYIVERRGIKILGTIEFHTFVYGKGTIEIGKWMQETARTIKILRTPSEDDLFSGKYNENRDVSSPCDATIGKNYIMADTGEGGVGVYIFVDHIWDPSALDEIEPPYSYETLNETDDIDKTTKGIQYGKIEVKESQIFTIARVKIALTIDIMGQETE
ncbi:unnamed protein product, partial [marine sediment metagenome]